MIFASCFAYVFMYLYLFSTNSSDGGNGWLNAVKTWFHSFKKETIFRKIFLFVFCVTIILFKTLLNRQIWLNPLADIIGEWWIVRTDPYTGSFTYNIPVIENTVMLVPFGFSGILLFSTIRGKCQFLDVFKHSAVYSFLFSLLIELAQLILRLGTFQLSDLFFNTIGGIIGGIICWMIYFFKHLLIYTLF